MEFIDLKKQYEVLKNDIDSGIQNVLNKNNYILGEDVKNLENELAKYVGVKHCISCGNGTDALSLSLKTLNIGKDDIVFVPTFTFFATAETVNLNGSACAFVDINGDTFNMSPESLERTIKLVLKDGKYMPKAITTVDLFGQCADYEKIKLIAKKYNLFLLEDAAQGFGGSINGKMACSFGHISTTSFFPAKPLGCYGDGGAIFTDNDEYAELLASLRFHGKGNDKYDNVRIGYNSRLDTIQAAILRVKLKAFNNYELANRQKIASIYDNELKNTIKTPFISPGYLSSYAQYTLTCETEVQRNYLQTKLKEQGIPSMIYYPKCMHEQSVYDGYKLNVDDLQVASSVSKRVLSIPMHPYLQDSDIERIVKAIKANI